MPEPYRRKQLTFTCTDDFRDKILSETATRMFNDTGEFIRYVLREYFERDRDNKNAEN